MALKFKLNKKAYDALSDEQKELYVAGETDGEFVLDVTDLPQGEDVGPIKRALEGERGKNKTLTQQLSDANDKISAFPDVDALKTTHEADKAKLTGFVNKSLKDSVALTLATKISTAPELLAPKIAERLSVDMTGDEPKTVILGADGKPDATMTIEKLSQEVVANPAYKAIIIASKASGAGGSAKPLIKPLGGGTPAQDGEQGFDASKAAPKDLAARIKERKEASAQQ
jgi:hypothetical protein